MSCEAPGCAVSYLQVVSALSSLPQYPQSMSVPPRLTAVKPALGKDRILIVDKYKLVAEAIKKLIEVELGLNVVGILSDTNSLLASYDNFKPNIAIVSIHWPYTYDLKAAQNLKSVFPQLKIIVLTTNENAKTADECVSSWASAYLEMNSERELVKSVLQVARGFRYLASDLQQRLEEAKLRDPWFESKRLVTERQRQVLKLLTAGCTMKKISETLHITTRTVAFHKYTLMTHLGLKSNADLFRFAIDQGIHGKNRVRGRATRRLKGADWRDKLQN